jgi:hypothetical protein
MEKLYQNNIAFLWEGSGDIREGEEEMKVIGRRSFN